MFTVAGYTGSTLSGFPVLVRIAEGSPSGFSYDDLRSKSTGADIAFVGMDGAGLPFEIDTWNTNGTSLIWVRLPTMEQNTQFVMCWGSDKSGKIVCPDSPFAGYVGVWHMSEASGAVADATGQGLAATPSGTAAATASVAVAGKVGNGRECASQAFLSIADDNALDVGNAFAVSGWFDMSSSQPSGDVRFFSRKVRSQSTNSGWEVIRKSGDIATRGSTGDNIASYTPSPSFAGAGWKHVFVVYANNTATIFEDGIQKASATAGAAPTDNDNSFSIGSYSGGGSSYFVGNVDECRLLDAVPSADWVKAEYDSVADSAFLTAGEAQAYEASAAPDLGLVASPSAVLYTNATLTASIGSLGKDDGMTTDAEWVDLLLVVSVNDDLSDPLFSIPSNHVSSVSSSFPVSIAPLMMNTMYYAKLFATNSFGVAGESSVVTFTTLDPGAPAGVATLMDRGFSTMTATATVSSFGVGGESANVRLEVSTDGFANVIAGAESDAALDTVVDLSVGGLSADTMYSIRVRIRNEWGIDTFVELPAMSTRAVPFATTGIGWTFSPDGSTIEITFGISGVYDGATGSATLTYDGVGRGAKPVNGAETLSWSGIAVVRGNPVARVELSAELNGQTYRQTFEAVIASGSTLVSVSDIMEHVSAETAVRVHPGDVVTLPELSGSEQYIVGNKLFASLDGNVLTALRPGIVGIHCIGNDYTTNTLAVLVLPEKIGNGNIYILRDGIIGKNWGNWNDPEWWEKLGSDTNDSWPREEDDIAIIAFYRNTSLNLDLRDGGCTMGALYVGGYRDAKASVTIRCVTTQNDVTLMSPVVFGRTDGEPARIQLCPNSPLAGDNDFRAKLTIADSIPTSSFRTDTIISGGSDRMDTSYPQGRFAFDAKLFDIAAGATVSLVEMDTYETGAALATMGGGRLTGAGTFWNRSAAAVRFGRNKTSFTGLLRDSGGYGHQQADRCGPTEIRSNSTNCTAETVGWVSVNASSQPHTWWKAGVGCVVIGHDHGHNAPTAHPGTNWFPRIVTLHGGWLQVLPHQVVWGDPGVLDRKYAQRLVVADGFSYFRAYSRSTSGGFPVNWFEADELGHENKATLRIDDDSRKNTALTADQATFLRGWEAVAVGPAGNPVSSDSYPTIPWIVSPLDGGNDKIYFPAFDSEGRLVRPALAENSTALSTFSAGRNAYCRNAGIALEEDLTVNSLYLQNDTKGKTLGAGRTLTVTSGGLILSDVNDDKNPGAAAIGEEGGMENGALVLGDADHPAYVWVCGATTSSANTAPNQIWAPVTAPGGFVAAYTGHLVLGGDQSGIAGEIAVNAGSLQLGTASSNCQLARNLPIRIFANATLCLPNVESARSAIVKFDGAAGWFGKVEVPEGIAAKCWKAYWRDYPETQEWQNLRRGVYTGDEATALANPKVVYDPEHFSGAGTLEVLRDDLAMPLVIRLK